jgi:hypothetical protein
MRREGTAKVILGRKISSSVTKNDKNSCYCLSGMYNVTEKVINGPIMLEGRFIMRIDILCKPENGNRCELVLQNVREALSDLGVQAEVHLFRDRRKMIDYRVYVSPALLIDDHVRIAGRIPEKQEIQSLLRERPRYLKRMQEVA